MEEKREKPHMRTYMHGRKENGLTCVFITTGAAGAVVIFSQRCAKQLHVAAEKAVALRRGA